MPRLFTALELPQRVATQMALARGGVVGARWLQAGDYHVTLKDSSATLTGAPRMTSSRRSATSAGRKRPFASRA